MTKDQLKAKYGRIANDDSQLTAFKDDLIDGEIPVNDARIPQPEAADANKLLTVDDEDNFVLSTVANAIGGTVQEMIADKADLVDGKVPSTQLPSYVDDVVEYASLNDFPEEGEQGKIYLAIDTGLCYRWSGTQYIQIAGSTSVLMFASQSNFPVEGEEGVIYVAEDTNKQFRWTGSAYVELSTANCIEVVEYQTTTPLTDAQVAKARVGKLAVRYNNDLLFMTSSTNMVVGFESMKKSNGSSGNSFVAKYTCDVVTCYLSVSTKMFSNDMTLSYGLLTDITSNVFGDTEIPSVSGKQIVRARNLRRTQDMIANVYTATATYAVGDCCIYLNDLYVCNTAISTAEAWNSSHWTLTNLVSLAPKAMTPLEVASILQFGGIVDPVLANNSWEMIRRVCEAGQAGNYWQLGDTKTDVGTDNVTRTFRICDMQGLYGKHVVFEQVELESTNYVWQPDPIIATYNDYSTSQMRTTHLPAILLKYSSELQSSITNTTYKVATNGLNGTLLDLTDKLFLPAEREIFANRNYSRTEEFNALTRYALYAANDTSNFRKKYKPGATSSNDWWLRSPYSGNTNNVCYVANNGNSNSYNAYYAVGVAPCFSF